MERTQRLTRDMVMLLDLAISRSRAEGHADEDVKEQIHGALEAAKQEIVHLQELVEERNGEPTRARGCGPGESARRSYRAGRGYQYDHGHRSDQAALPDRLQILVDYIRGWSKPRGRECPDLYAVLSRASKSGKEVGGVQRNREPGDCRPDGNRADRNHTVDYLKEASYGPGLDKGLRPWSRLTSPASSATGPFGPGQSLELGSRPLPSSSLFFMPLFAQVS